MSKIRALIIDDEALARQIIQTYLLKDEEMEIVGECANGFEGFKKIQELSPDVVFLDIMMPKLTGFEMLELLDKPPLIVFSTAYDEYAIKAFEQNAVDYLLKPYSADRFAEALKKVKQKLASKDANSEAIQSVLEQHRSREETLQRIAVRNGSNIHIVGIDSIQYLEAMDDYVKLHTEEGKFLKQETMKYYEQHLPLEDFVRIHRSYIVRVKAINRLEPMGKDTHVVLLKDGTQLPVSRSGYGRLRKVLQF